MYKRGICTQNQIVCYDPTIKSKVNKQTITKKAPCLFSQLVSLHPCQPSFPSSKELERRSRTFFLDIFLLWRGVTLQHECFLIWRGEREWSLTACGQRRWKEVFLRMESCRNDTSVHFSGFLSMAILSTPPFSSAHSLALLHGAGFVPAMLYLQHLGWMKDSDTQPPFLHLGYATTCWANRICFLPPHKYQQHHEIWAALAQIWCPALPEEGYAEVSWTALQTENASASTPQKSQKLTVDTINLKMYPTAAQNKKSCEGQGRSWNKKSRQAKMFGVGVQY